MLSQKESTDVVAEDLEELLLHAFAACPARARELKAGAGKADDRPARGGIVGR
jgi:hypothetical protein